MTRSELLELVIADEVMMASRNPDLMQQFVYKVANDYYSNLDDDELAELCNHYGYEPVWD